MPRAEPSTRVNVNAVTSQGMGAGGFALPTKSSHWAVVPWHEASLWSQAHTSLTVL